MNNIRLDRRSFLRGMLGISVAAVVLPNLPAFPEITLPPEVLAQAEALDFKVLPKVRYGPLGRLRLMDKWFPLDNASFTMFRRHTQPIYQPSATKIGQYDVVVPSHLVNSPWQVELWTPDIEVHGFFRDQGELEFEIDTRYTRFLGAGYVTISETNYTAGEVDGQEALFSLTLEGDTKLRRFGDREIQELDL